jgi:hypothetical protein
MYTTKLNELITLLTSALEDAERFDNSNDTAGKRLRQVAQTAKTKLQEFRLEIQEERVARAHNKKTATRNQGT